MPELSRWSVLALLCLAIGCDAAGDGPAQPTSKPTAVRSAAPPRDGSVPGSAAASATAAPAQAHAGRWSATYRAAKAEVAVPKDAPSRTWAEDDGKTAAGEGTIDLHIAPDGAVKGRAKGALGEQNIRGVFDGSTLRAGLTPTDPAAELVMSGVLLGTVKGGEIGAQLRVSSHDASIVRAAAVQLARP